MKITVLGLLRERNLMSGLMLIFLSSYGRDSVEPAVKPGETALVCMFPHKWKFLNWGKSFIYYLDVCVFTSTATYISLLFNFLCLAKKNH